MSTSCCTGLSVDFIVAASVVPFVVALLLFALLIVWQKARRRRLERSGSTDLIAEDVDGQNHSDGTKGSGNDSGSVSTCCRLHSISDIFLVGIEIIIEEVGTVVKDKLDGGIQRSPVKSKPVDAKYHEPEMLYESQRGRTAWVLPPLLGIEQEFPRDQLCSLKVLGAGKYAKVSGTTLSDWCR